MKAPYELALIDYASYSATQAFFAATECYLMQGFPDAKPSHTEINMGLNVAQKLIESHLLSGAMTAGKEIGIRIDQTLTQDATGTLVMLELESIGLDSARTELSCQYVDHNLIRRA